MECKTCHRWGKGALVGGVIFFCVDEHLMDGHWLAPILYEATSQRSCCGFRVEVSS